MTASFTIGLVGNPNCGKSTLFNELTGGRQHVGNWPGKTVEKKAGKIRISGHEIEIVDLPGTYSMSAFSAEEVIARDFIVEERPSAVVAVIDAANLERNLYLVVQLLELRVPLILALNMSDVAENRHIKIKKQELSESLGGVPVISTVGNRAIGLDALKTAIIQVAVRQTVDSPPQVQLGDPIECEIGTLQRLIQREPQLSRLYPSRWLATKLLEADPDIRGRLGDSASLLNATDQAISRITEKTGEEPDTLIADRRYGFIGELVSRVVSRPSTDVVTASDKIDRVLTHRVWGLLIFLFFMWIVFQFVANVSVPYKDWLDSAIRGPITHWAASVLAILGLSRTWIESLLLDGVIAGVGGVLTFIPVLFALYFAIAILEDSGYMARAAFVMDRFMYALGMHGKSFIPLLIGFGCTVPAIYATRTLENEHDRKITGFLATFASCGARLPVYALFGAAFWGASSGTLIFGIYMLGIVVAILTSLLLTRIVFRNKPTPPFVMELPPYRAPSLKSVLIHMWERSAAFLRKAGTIIMSISVIIWFLLAIPANLNTSSFANIKPEDSLFGAISHTLAPVFAPAGFGKWQTAGALVTGFLAKEVIVSTISQAYVAEVSNRGQATPSSLAEDIRGIAVGFGNASMLTLQELINIIPRTVNLIPGAKMPEVSLVTTVEQGTNTASLEAALRNAFSPLAGLAFCIFVLLYVPCMSATAAMRGEFGMRWTLLQVGYTLTVAWLAAVAVYQGGLLLRLGGR